MSGPAGVAAGETVDRRYVSTPTSLDRCHPALRFGEQAPDGPREAGRGPRVVVEE